MPGGASILESSAATKARLRELAARAPATIPDAAVPGDFRRAAVLALVGRVGHDGTPGLVLTERSAHLRAHAGEICLPGGRLDDGETPEAAAVREAEEEVGVDHSGLEVMGRLDDAWSKGRNHVVPVVAWYDAPLEDLRPMTGEVAQMFVTPLTMLARPDAHRLDIVEARGHRFENDVIDAGACQVYGFTADVVLDLLAFLTGTERDRVPQRLLDLDRDGADLMDDERRIVRAGYDEVAEAYLADRTREGGDVDALVELLARLAPGARVLDAGCGAGVPVAARLVADGFVTVGLDFSLGQLRLGNEHVRGWRPVQGDLTQLPFPDAAFDAVVSFYAVIHVPRSLHPEIFREVHRVLRPGGWALLCLGAADLPEDDDPVSWLGTRMYWSHYDAATNLGLLREAGFTVDDDREVPDPMGHRGHLFARVRRADA